MKAGQVSVLIATLAVALPAAAWAQEEGDPAPPVESSATMEEIPPPDENASDEAALDDAPLDEDGPPDDERLPDPGEARTVVKEKSGDVLSMPEPPREPPPRRVLPHHGLSMSDVEREYGRPDTRHPAVGQPPITRWDYDGFSVFFEHRTVLHSVQQDRPAEIVNRDELLPP
jgi:hypothetical protein